MYYVDASAFPYTVERRTAPRPEGPWSGPSPVRGIAAPPERMLWHLDAFQDDGATVLLLDTTEVYRTRAGGQLFVAVSEDGVTFRQGAKPLLGPSSGWDRSIYRSCCLPSQREGRKVYTVWYSAWGPELGWRLGLTEVAPAPR